MDRRGHNQLFHRRFRISQRLSIKSLATYTQYVCQLLPNATCLYNDPRHAVDRGDILLDLIMVILFPFPTPIWQTLHCQSWLTNHAEEWHQVSESHNWPQACRRTHSNRKHQMSSMLEHAKGKDVAYMALPYQRLPSPSKGLHFHQAGWSARLTTVLWLFSLTARRAYWLPGTRRSFMWWVLKRGICFCQYKD